MMRAPSLPDVPVIIADPDEYSRRLMREMLRAARIRRIHEVTTAEVLVTRLQSVGTCVTFLDLELPGLNAPSVASILEATMPRSIGMSRRVTLELACSAGKMFAGGILAKPFTPSALWSRIVGLLDGMSGIDLAAGAISDAQVRRSRPLGAAGAR